MLGGSPPPSLFENTVEEELTQDLAVLTSDCDRPWLCRVSELSVVTSRPVQIPSISYQHPDNLDCLVAFHTSFP